MNADAHASVGGVGIPGDPGSHGKYRILTQLGEGGMATVHLAVACGPSGFNKLVVLKTLRAGLADDPEFREMFLREARVAARLNHPGVVQTYEVFATTGAPVIVMEYLDGQTLAKLRQRAKTDLSLYSHLRIIGDATGALNYAHELADFDGRALGLVHRDMTPHNVFVTYNGQVKLLDFGIAKLTTSDLETQSGVIKGKLRYMPPEQLAGEPVDRRADIYAVGVMLWEAATGQTMWKGCSDVAVMRNVLNGDIVRPRSIQPQVPERLEAICMKALSPGRAERYATAAELETDLDALLDELGSRVNSRAIGKFTSTLFADTRAETKALIESQLSKVALLPLADFELLPSEALESVSIKLNGSSPPVEHEEHEEQEAPRPTVAASVPTTADARSPTPRPVSRRQRSVLLGVGAIGLLSLIGVALTHRSKPAATARSTVATTSAAATSPAVVAVASTAPNTPPVATRVSIRISATPPEARLRLDGELLPRNPFVRSLPPDGSQHTVSVAAPGFKSRYSTFSAERDAEIVVDLERATPVIAASTPRETPSPAGAPRPPRPRAVDCNPPYWLDSSGIKRFKLECL